MVDCTAFCSSYSLLPCSGYFKLVLGNGPREMKVGLLCQQNKTWRNVKCSWFVQSTWFVQCLKRYQIDFYDVSLISLYLVLCLNIQQELIYLQTFSQTLISASLKSTHMKAIGEVKFPLKMKRPGTLLRQLQKCGICKSGLVLRLVWRFPNIEKSMGYAW